MDLWATDAGCVLMAEYFECMAKKMLIATTLDLHENPGIPEVWPARFMKRSKRSHYSQYQKNKLYVDTMIELGFLSLGDNRRRPANPRYKACFTLADENVSWVLIEILEFLLRKNEKERTGLRSLLRWTLAGADRGTMDHPLIQG